jgi:hypothetical protein
LIGSTRGGTRGEEDSEEASAYFLSARYLPIP